MSCGDTNYVYICEEGYASKEGSSDSIASEIVEDAFRKVDLSSGNRNVMGRSESSEGSDTDEILKNQNTFNIEGQHYCLSVTGTHTDLPGDAGSFNIHDIASNNDIYTEDNAKPARRTASDGLLPVKNVQFKLDTSRSKSEGKYEIPQRRGSSGISLGTMQTADCNVDELTPQLPFMPYCENFRTVSPPPLSSIHHTAGQIESNMVDFEAELTKLVNHSTDGTTGSNANYKRVTNRMTSALHQKWLNHREKLEVFLCDTDKQHDHYIAMRSRLLEQNNLIFKLKNERRALELCLEDKEYEWLTVKKSLRADNGYLRNIWKECQYSKDHDKSGGLWKVLESLLHVHFDREKAKSLDYTKQNKINELRLLVCRQQLHLAEIEERNRQLEFEIGQLAGDKQPLPADRNQSCLSDVLHCDHSLYMPHYSTNPEFVTLQAFGIGGHHYDLVYDKEDIFNPSEMFPRDTADKQARDLAEYDKLLIDELANNGPGSSTFALNESRSENVGCSKTDSCLID